MLVYEQYSFNRPSHAVLFKVFSHAVEPRLHRPILFIHGILRSKGVVREWIQVQHALARHLLSFFCFKLSAPPPITFYCGLKRVNVVIEFNLLPTNFYFGKWRLSVSFCFPGVRPLWVSQTFCKATGFIGSRISYLFIFFSGGIVTSKTTVQRILLPLASQVSSNK